MHFQKWVYSMSEFQHFFKVLSFIFKILAVISFSESHPAKLKDNFWYKLFI